MAKTAPSLSAHAFGGTWTDQKLRVVKEYLDAYVQVMKKQSFRLLYIDGFAGTGERDRKQMEDQGTLIPVPELDQMTKGSAKLALEVEPPFHEYILIDQKRRHTEALEKLRGEYPTRKITVLHNDANVAVQSICRDHAWKSERAVLFLDPYGMQVSWETLAAAARTKAMDVWVLFPSGIGLNRVLTNDGSNMPASWLQTTDRFLGCDTWRNVFYREVPSVDLFGERRVSREKNATTTDFEKFFLERLGTIFEGVAPQGVPLVNSRGHTMYSLCFACANARGTEIALRVAKAVMRTKR